MLLITDEQVAASLSVNDCVDAMENAFRDLAQGTANDSPRERLFVGESGDPKLYSLGRQCGAIRRFEVAALRVMSNRRAEVRGPKDNHFILLFSTETGQLLAIIQGFTLSGLRLGATTAIAAKYLAPKCELEVGVFGTGKQARANFEGIAAVTKIARAKVFSRSADQIGSQRNTWPPSASWKWEFLARANRREPTSKVSLPLPKSPGPKFLAGAQITEGISAR